MKKVDVDKIEYYSWDCPECGQFNRHDSQDCCHNVSCDGCGEQFEIGSVN